MIDARDGTKANGTRIERVTLFEDRAEIVRIGTTKLARGGQWVAFAGATPFVDDRSLQAKVAQPASGVRVVGARVTRRVGHEQTIGHDEIAHLEKAARAAARAVQEAEIAAERARRRGDHARAVLAQWTAGLTRVPPGLAGARLASWRGAYDEVLAAEARALEAARESRAAGVRAEDAWLAAQARLRDGQATHVRHEALLEVNIEAEADIEAAQIELTYRTAGALWRPEHAARVTGIGPSARLELLTWATVWQRTGEAWDDIDLCLSTARPAEHATPPLVTDDLVSSRRKTDEERRTTVVEGREQTIERAGAEGARVVEQMPGVDDGGAPLVYRSKSRAHVPGGGRPVRIEIARVSLAARVDVVIYPELASVAHLRARATLESAGPLLAGPVHVTHDGNAAGRSRTRFVGAGEPFELGVGTEDALRVRRSVEAEDDTTAIVGTQRKKRTVTVWLTNLSSTAKRAKVIERVPVSEIEGVEATFLGPKEWSFDGKDGFAEREVDVLPHATQKLVLNFEVRAGSKMVLPQI